MNRKHRKMIEMMK